MVQDGESHQIIYFKIYKCQIRVIEQALESAACFRVPTNPAALSCGSTSGGGKPRDPVTQLLGSSSFSLGQEKRDFLDHVSAKAS